MFNGKVIMETVHGVTVYTQEVSVADEEIKWYDGEDKAFKDGAFSAEEELCKQAGYDMSGWTVEMNTRTIYTTAYGSEVDWVYVNETGGTIYVEDKYREPEDVINNPDVYIEPDKFDFLKERSKETTAIYRNYVKDRDLVFVWIINNIDRDLDTRMHRNVKIRDKTMACGYSIEDRLGLYKSDAYIYTKGGELIREPNTKSSRGYPIPKKVDFDYKRAVWDKNVINNL